MKKLSITIASLAFISSTLFGQFRAAGRTGINVFEVPKTDLQFNGMKVTLGGDFTLGFQALNHSNLAKIYFKKNPALTNKDASLIESYDANKLVLIKPGFNAPGANLSVNVAMADGIDMKMELYLSSRHHVETWVKGGYIQFNKIPFINLDVIDNIMKFTTLKVGYMDVNYGDAHFRRSDNGSAIYNPFIENYIMDEFTTEIGAEAIVNFEGIVAVGGITTGQIQGNISAPTLGTGPNTLGINDTVTNGLRRPAVLAKIGYDKRILNEKLRIRATGSVYYTAGSTDATLFAGDRCGSHYWGVMDNTLLGATFTNENVAYTSGRYDPVFNDKITAIMGNLFLDYKIADKINIESFSTVEHTTGRGKNEATGERFARQIATDLVIRYDNFFVGGRYNAVYAQQYLAADLGNVTGVPSGAPIGTEKVTFIGQQKGMYNVNIDRIAVSAGWFITKNIMAKVEYTTQKYGGFVYNDIRHEGKFDGFIAEAVVGF